MTAKLVSDLHDLLADYQVLYAKLRGFHWNVQGPLFFGLHMKFEELYNTTAERTDSIAERLAALGERPVACLKTALERTSLDEGADVTEATDMVRAIHGDFENLNERLRKLSAKAAEKGDTATQNLLDGFADEQEKEAWMLRAFLAS
jgi:starvation-inducible DNA-binding protein